MLLAMHQLWPEAPIFTAMATHEWAKRCKKKEIVIKTSFMQKLPFKPQLYKLYFWLYPLAFESFNFDDFDVVLSSSARFAHGIITKPATLHVCYMNTPGRMWWEANSYFQNRPLVKLLLLPFISYLRLWDYAASGRVDYFIANSKTPQKRIKKYFGREAEVVYPFAEEKQQLTNKKKQSAEEFCDYFLIVTRLVAWKKVEVAIEACQKLAVKLVIVGEGSDKARLCRLAGDGQLITFVGRVNDKTLSELYQNSKAVIITQEEDFGIVAVEAASFYKPVLAFRGGGNLETVVAGKTGEFFYPQTAEALTTLINGFNVNLYKNTAPFEEISRRFSKDRFSVELKGAVEGAVAKFYDLHHLKKNS